MPALEREGKWCCCMQHGCTQLRNQQVALECILFLFSQRAEGNQVHSVCGEAQEVCSTSAGGFWESSQYSQRGTWARVLGVKEFISGAVNGLLCSGLRSRVRWDGRGRFGFLHVSGEFPIVQKQNQSLLRNPVQVLWTPTALQPFDSV